MKEGIHPKYEATTVSCGCGNSFETRTVRGGEMRVDICNACHPFYTGKLKFVDTAGKRNSPPAPTAAFKRRRAKRNSEFIRAVRLR